MATRNAASGRSVISANWSVQYEADALPSASSPVWTNVGSGVTESASGGILNQTQTPVDNSIYYNLEDTRISHSTGITLEARIRINSAEIFDCILGAELGNSVAWGYLYLSSTNIEISEGVVSTSSYSVDTTDDYHIYRVTIKDNVVTGYMDGVQRVQATLNNTSSTQTVFQFGSFGSDSGATLDVDWDYVYVRSDGAFAPRERNNASSRSAASGRTAV